MRESLLIPKQKVKEMPRTLATYYDVLTKAFGCLSFQKNIVLAIGNTGSGKTTLLSSLMYGTDILEERTIETLVTREV